MQRVPVCAQMVEQLRHQMEKWRESTAVVADLEWDLCASHRFLLEELTSCFGGQSALAAWSAHICPLFQADLPQQLESMVKSKSIMPWCCRVSLTKLSIKKNPLCKELSFTRKDSVSMVLVLSSSSYAFFLAWIRNFPAHFGSHEFTFYSCMYSDFSAVKQVVAAGCLLTLKNRLLVFCCICKCSLKNSSSLLFWH